MSRVKCPILALASAPNRIITKGFKQTTTNTTGAVTTIPIARAICLKINLEPETIFQNSVRAPPCLTAASWRSQKCLYAINAKKTNYWRNYSVSALPKTWRAQNPNATFCVGKYGMGKSYDQLSIEEQTLIQTQLSIGMKPVEIAEGLKRSASTLSRELRRNDWVPPKTQRSRGRPLVSGSYRAAAAPLCAHAYRIKPQITKRLRPRTALWHHVFD